MPWIIADFLPVSLFALRPAMATTSGGKTLLAPTPFSLKMALLNATIQTQGIDVGKSRFLAIRDLRIALALPRHVTVIKSFAKVLREVEFKGKALEKPVWLDAKRDAGEYPFGKTIAYREFVQYGDPLGATEMNTLSLAFTAPAGESPSWLSEILGAINYFGKRGGFFQLASAPKQHAEPDDRFTHLTEPSTEFALNGTLQQLDDCGSAMTFEHADIYSSKSIRLGKERILRHVVLPYRLVRSSRSYSLYERV